MSGQSSVPSTVPSRFRCNFKRCQEFSYYLVPLTHKFLTMRFTIFIALILSTTFFVGCGTDKSNPFGAVYVEGVVTLDGNPIEGATVTFNPRDGDQAAGGTTDARGKFTVQTGGAPVGSGAKPGVYDVTLRKSRVVGGELSQEEYQQQYGNKPLETVYLIPQKYGRTNTSGFEPITVSNNKADNQFTFDLSSE